MILEEKNLTLKNFNFFKILKQESGYWLVKVSCPENLFDPNDSTGQLWKALKNYSDEKHLTDNSIIKVRTMKIFHYKNLL